MESLQSSHTDKFYIPDFILNPVGQTLSEELEREREGEFRYLDTMFRTYQLAPLSRQQCLTFVVVSKLTSGYCLLYRFANANLMSSLTVLLYFSYFLFVFFTESSILSYCEVI